MPESLAVACPVIVCACLIFADDKGPREKLPTQGSDGEIVRDEVTGKPLLTASV